MHWRDTPHAADTSMPLHYSLSATGPGPMQWWMNGFADALRESSMFTPGVSRTTGVSGGAIAAVCMQAGVSLAPDSDFQHAMRAAKAERKPSQLHVIQQALEDTLPSDVATRINGLAVVATAEYDGSLWGTVRNARPVLFDRFDDKADVIGAVCASCMMPFVMSSDSYMTWRGRRYTDAFATGDGIVDVPGAVHVHVCHPPGYTPAGQISPSTDMIRRLFFNRHSDAPSDVHPWMASPADEISDAQRCPLPSTNVLLAAELLGYRLPKGGATERYRMGKEAFGVWSRRELALRL